MSAELFNQTALAAATRRGRNLEYLTIGCDSLETIASIGAGDCSGNFKHAYIFGKF